MPEFFPEHIPDDVEEDSFLGGYLAAAEWVGLNDDQVNDWQCRCDDEWRTDTGPCRFCGMSCPYDCLPDDRSRIRGWSAEALKTAKEVCEEFQNGNAAALAIYYEESGRGESSAGHDFWLSRNGHGAGFFDRGEHEAFRELQDAAKVYSSQGVTVSRGEMYFEPG